MKSYRFKALLQNQNWIENATVSIDKAGKIISISQTEKADSIFIDGYALPGFQNAHSHAFQYAMAGLAENHSGDDDFWSWRETMYRLALESESRTIQKNRRDALCGISAKRLYECRRISLCSSR